MDVFGNALLDFYKKGETEILWLHNSYDEPEEMPIDIFFRKYEEMPELEHIALTRCYGKVLDVGAGVGSHTLILQNSGYDVTAIDVSAKAIQIMKDRGVKKAMELDICKVTAQYDTLLFLMNGIGLTGTLAGFTAFLEQAKKLICPQGQLIFDSSNISYLYGEHPKPENKYFGEVSYQYEYDNQKGKSFNWVYIDEETLIHTATQAGWKCEIIFEDGEEQYLARLSIAI
jgi:2-polyprenyl-3-methyl-5-hydroxy-6-metoxy-1,4-benzoquinol methylase